VPFRSVLAGLYIRFSRSQKRAVLVVQSTVDDASRTSSRELTGLGVTRWRK